MTGLVIIGLVAHLIMTGFYAPAMALAGAGAAPGATNGAQRITLCTPSGFKTVTVRADDSLQEDPAPATPAAFCLICMGLAGCAAVAPPALAEASVPALEGGIRVAFRTTFTRPANGDAPVPVSRGPPV